MSWITHLILTRFNCRFAATWTRAALDPEWLAARFELFERYCLPSVLAQTSDSFRWIVFLDQATPPQFKGRIDQISDPRVRPVYVDLLSGDVVRQTIRANIAPGSTHVLTTRLDNDDAISSDFARRLQQSCQGRSRAYLNFPGGFVIHRGRVYRHRDRHNAFVSLLEPASDPEGVWTVPHTEISTHAPVHQVPGGPAWIQVIHEANVSNKVRGRRCAASEIGPEFVFNRSGLHTEPEGLRVFLDRNLLYPVWRLRDGLAEGRRRLRRAVRIVH